MKLIRFLLGKVILLLNALFPPKAVVRTLAEQERINAGLASLSLYQYEACPFCVKVRRFLRAQAITIELRDAKKDPARQELLEGGGKLQVPCLRIPQGNGRDHWLYESSDIISYLKTELKL